MSERKPRRLAVGLGLTVASGLVLAGFQLYLFAGLGPELREARQWVAHTTDVIEASHALARTVRDAERAQRGYLISGDTAMLGPYRSGVEQAPTLIGTIKTLTADNPEQQARIPTLQAQAAAKFTELQSQIEAREKGGFDAVKNLLQVGSLKAIDGTLNAIIATENKLLATRQDAVESGIVRTTHLALFSGGLALLTLLAGSGTIIAGLRNLARSEASRRDAESRYSRLIHGVKDYAIFTLDPQGLITDWNTGAARILGYRQDEIVGQSFARFHPKESDPDLATRALEIAAQDGKFETETPHLRKDGSHFVASVLIEPIHDAAGKIVGFAKITRDITAQLRQREALEQARAALSQSQKMQALGQLVGGIAHDFNNLLTVIIGPVGLLRERLKESDGQTLRLVDSIGRAAERAAALTQRLLAFSRRQPLAPKPVDVNKLIAGTADLLRRTLGEQTALETVLAGGLWTVSIDENQLENALINLAVNARDAMPQGGKLTIETGNAYLDTDYTARHAEVEAGQYVMVAVSDTGTGMPAEVAAVAFEPFFTTKSEQGTGLGLSQVYGFIKQSGGHVKIYSEPGAGTTVKLYLPRPASAVVAETPATAQPLPAPAANHAPVLVVEDDEAVRSYTVEALTGLGYRVHAAGDAQTALRLLETNPAIGLLLTDIGLPGLNGRQLADEAARRWPKLKIVFMTAYTRNAIIHHGRLDPGVILVTKPFTQRALAEGLRRGFDG